MNREHVKETALAMVREAGLINLSRRALCVRAGLPDGSFPHVMGCNFTEFLSEIKTDAPERTTLAVSKTRTDPALRRQQILDVAVELARKGDYTRVTRGQVAEAAGCSGGLVTRYFKTMTQLKKAIIRAAVRDGVVEIVAQGIARRDPQARKASPDLKNEAARLIANY